MKLQDPRLFLRATRAPRPVPGQYRPPAVAADRYRLVGLLLAATLIYLLFGCVRYHRDRPYRKGNYRHQSAAPASYTPTGACYSPLFI